MQVVVIIRNVKMALTLTTRNRKIKAKKTKLSYQSYRERA
jgi:hypothetical protein